MTSIKTGFISGAIATYVTGSLLLMNNALRQFPDVHIAKSLSALLGTPEQTMVGVVVILITGIFVLGGLFAVLAHRLPVHTSLARGLMIGAASWLVMMLVYMPLTGAGLFGLERSAIVPFVTLVLNLVYWVVLSVTCRWLTAPVEMTGGAET
jgi:hypothetical protein